MLAELLTPENILAFISLTSLEIVLGIDNIIFIAILAGKLPPEKRNIARQLGIAVAVISRIALLFSIGWVIRLKDPLFTLSLPDGWGLDFEQAVTGKDLVVFFGGLFLLVKATYEIHHKVEGLHAAQAAGRAAATLPAMLAQVFFIDVVFSLDSVITAVGMSKNITVMVAAILTSVVVMLLFARAIVEFVERNPAIKLLALAFLLLIGVLLVAEAFHHKIPKGYIYFAMAFSLGIELLQMRAEANARRHHPAPPPPT